MTSRPLNSLSIWKESIAFHVTNFWTLLPVYPLLFVPVVADAMHSLLINQQVHKGTLAPVQAAKDVWGLIPSLFAMKARFEFSAFLWGFVPIYGIIQGARHRIYWAMASNVLVFENRSGQSGRQRCQELAQSIPGGAAVRTLITLPALLFVLVLIGWVATATSTGTVGFWLFIAICLWLGISVSGAVNTFFYLRLRDNIDPS